MHKTRKVAVKIEKPSIGLIKLTNAELTPVHRQGGTTPTQN